MDGAAWIRSVEDSNAQAEKRARLAELSAFMNLAHSLEDLLPTAQARITEFFGAERSTMYAIDPATDQFYSIAKTGADIKEIRVPRDTTSITGFVGVSKAPVNLRNVYDAAELTRVSPKLRFDDRWDKVSGFKTRSMMTVPILRDKTLLGVIQVINRRDGLPFMPRDVANAEEVARMLGGAIATLNARAAGPKAASFPAVPVVAVPPASTPVAAKTPARAGKWDLLVESGVIPPDALARGLATAAASALDPARYLVEKMGINRVDVEKALSQFHGCEFFRFTGKETIPEELRSRLRVDFLKKICAAPIERRGAQLVVVIDDPADIDRTDALRLLDSDRSLLIQVGFRDEILACIEHSYGLRGDVGLILKELSTDEGTGAIEETVVDDEGRGGESDSAVIKLANQVIIDAYRRGASDIHIEPNGKEENTTIRFRIDGECVAYQDIPPAYRNPLVARFKIMSKLDISERRKPQDGKIRFRMQDRQIELRVATLPTVNGNEDVVMRILAASKPLPLAEMGMSERNLRGLKEIVAKPYGLVLCVGPTGSGKTTTLHSALGHINTVDMKIWTAEDPVEITQPGLRQVQVQAKIGFDFATAMRAFLRADPDVIMVGEMRDKETASTGIEASLTGHLVLSTLHTNSAPETITRLIDMDLDPFSFADALLGVLAQRLARGICKKCRQEYVADKDEVTAIIEAFGPEQAEARGYRLGEVKLFRGAGCETCGKSGYKGRVALHELLLNNDEIKHAITHRAPVEQIRQLAMKGGMTTLLQDGIEKAMAGKTDLKQVLAVCSR